MSISNLKKLFSISIVFLIKAIRKLKLFLHKEDNYGPECIIDRDKANYIIYHALMGPDPCMIGRFGTVELNSLVNFISIKKNENFLVKLYRYIMGSAHLPLWDRAHFRSLEINAGFFPVNEINCELFAKRYLDDLKSLNILGSFQNKEKFLQLDKEIKRVQLETLYPFFVEKPWTVALKKKKVLVVHPFADSIQKQYKIKEFLFENKSILPDFDLITLKSVQSSAGETSRFGSWFEALKFMEDEITNIDFDICLIGCGAYGFPIAAHVKRMGKKSIHLGGGLQLLFGIKGKRWERDYLGIYEYRPGVYLDIEYKKFFNSFWVYPSLDERPRKSNLVEDSCYW